MKEFILNADDFGMSAAINRAVEEGFPCGLLKSVSLCANGSFFDNAVDTILPKCEGIGVGVHLNITSGKSLCTDLTKLTDKDMKFNNSFFSILIKAYNPKDKTFLEEIEREFRRQIEKVMAAAKVYHIDSHSHIHAIPVIFDMVCRLAKEYEIPQVRTHFENFYFVPDIFKILNKNFFVNSVKKIILNLFSVFNENTVVKYELQTNDYLIGLAYADSMDARTIYYGVNSLGYYPKVRVEAVIHPSRYDEGTIDNRFDEYMAARNEKLKQKIEKMGFNITNYVREQQQDDQES